MRLFLLPPSSAPPLHHFGGVFLLCGRIGLAWWDILRGCRGPTSSFFFFFSGGAQLLLLFSLRFCLCLALGFAFCATFSFWRYCTHGQQWQAGKAAMYYVWQANCQTRCAWCSCRDAAKGNKGQNACHLDLLLHRARNNYTVGREVQGIKNGKIYAN